ncbi:MAG: OmpA family protein [Acidobacteriia bacterium]|nr:OmpA family protein [Terriglobia bacterium]
MKRLTLGLLTVCGVLAAQAPAQNQERRENADRTAAGLAPIYRVTVTERTAKAISYQHRSGATKIDFSGTSLMPKAHGEAKVESKKGYIEIEVEFRDMTEATQFGGEYLTYVLWAITPEGRTSNLGEVLRGGGTSGKLDVTTELQVFGLIVTAEPYFAVSRPSDVVVMENVVRKDTVGKIELIDAKYELLQRGQYEHLANVLDLKVNSKMPLELYEARNAVNIARKSGADRYATETFLKAESNLKQSEAYRARNAGSKPVTMTARQAVQIAEDSRAIAVKRQDDDLLAAERQAGAAREARAENATARAENATANAQSETARIAREAATARLSAQAEADRLKRENDAKTAAAQNDAERLKRENDLRASTAQATADRLKQDNDAKMAAAQSEADRLRRDNDAQKANAQSELDRIAGEKRQLETDKSELRAQLLLQFNTILQTRDTARGLIVNMSDVLFDTAKFSLRPEAREKLAKVAGIVAGHPGLSLAVEGHTDNVGGDDYNQKLSEQRGSAVRDYLTQQGIQPDSVSTKGFGKTQPVASNETASGRQQNRRVELVISGEIIGKELGVPIAAR